MYKLEFESEALEFILSQNAKNQDLIKEKIKSLKEGNFHKDKALKGFYKGKFRKRAGDFRIIYLKENFNIYILKIAHRKESYKD